DTSLEKLYEKFATCLMNIKNIFPLILEIKSKLGILHFRRWRIFSCKCFSIFLHEILQPDQDGYPHTHPWNFYSLILWGSYLEKLETKNSSLQILHTPLSFYKRTENQFHQIEKVKKQFAFCGFDFESNKVYSIVIVILALDQLVDDDPWLDE